MEMTYKKFAKKIKTEILPNKPTFIREGQAIMNYLADIWIEEYKRISSVQFYEEEYIDCFYNDNLIPNTMKHLEKVWSNYPN